MTGVTLNRPKVCASDKGWNMKNNDKIVGYVYETYDYGKFKKMDFNRKTGEVRIQKVIESFKEGEVLNPIIVNKRFYVGDGQARFEAKKRLERPIQYVIDDRVTIEDCRRMNRFNTPWGAHDFAVSYAESGKNDYHRLLAICDEQNISISLALRLANKGSAGKQNSVYDGTLKFSSDDMEQVRNCMILANELKKVSAYTKRLGQAFYISCLVCQQTNGFDQARMIKNFEKCRSSFVAVANLEGMLKEFSRIYNKYGKSSEKLYFEDYMRNRGSNIRDYAEDAKRLSNHKADDDFSTLRRE